MQVPTDGKGFGIERLLGFLKNAIEMSEEAAIRNGTNYVEAEHEAVVYLQDIARTFGGDITDPQWYAGFTTALSVLAHHATQDPLLAITTDPITSIYGNALARTHDELIRKGVTVFSGNG